MGRSIGKFAILSALVGLAVLFGMELADDGIRSVYGPVGGDGASAVSDGSRTNDSSASGQRSRYYAEEPQGIAYDDGAAAPRTDRRNAATGRATAQEQPLATQDPYEIPRPGGEPLVDSLADKTASTLQRLSQGGVRAVVSLFDKLSGS